MPRWTEEQQLAIEKEGCNIIVSAGAGSGKTAVLTARVLRKLKSGVNINQLLILTFTNKAAFEMKDRIRKSIRENPDILEQLDYIDASYITTFDSFALSMVKKYSYLLNISKNLSIADSSIIYLEKKRILDSIFERLYEEGEEKFFSLVDSFCMKKDDELKEGILSIYDKLDLKYDKISYLDSYLSNYYSDQNISYFLSLYLDFLKKLVREIDSSITEISHFVSVDYLDSLHSVFSPLLNSNSYLEIKNSIDFKIPSIPRGSDEGAKEIKEKISSNITRIKELVRFDNEEVMKDYFFSTKSYASIIISILKELDKRILEYKKSLNLYEFADISKMAIQIVKEHDIIREELTKSFREIMIDEYQDTSDLQEEFISMIMNNNVYMVGDIKQSIYRFRNANPYLFKEKYDNYSKGLGGFKIDLTKNFRSRKEVIEDINLLFSKIMTDEVGGANYSSSHKMLFGNQTYIEEGKTSQDQHLELYHYDYDKEIGYTKEEVEAFFLAKDILEKVNHHYQVFDRDLGTLRDIQFGDFAVLLDKSTNFDLYKKIFQYFNIPVTKFSSTNIVSEIEIVLIKHLLNLIIHRKKRNYDSSFQYSFIAVLRSYLFSFPDEEIFKMLSKKEYDCSLMKKIDEIVLKMDTLSIQEIVYELIDLFDFYNCFILVGDVKNRMNRLIFIIKIFENFAGMNYTIYDAYQYLEEVIESEYKIEIKDLDSSSNSVKLMTIHASKGLEFPICYFSSMHSRFNIRELNEKFMYNNDYGIICPYYDLGIGKTFVKDLVKEKYLLEEVSEKIRLFYVALTRAKEKMIVVTSFPSKKMGTMEEARSFLDMLVYAKDSISSYVKPLSLESLNLTKDYDFIKESNYQENIEKSSVQRKKKEVTILEEEVLKEKISKGNETLLDMNIKKNMDFGTKMHEVLEYLDFQNPCYEKLDLDDFYKEKIKEFLRLIDVDHALNFYKEYEFFYEKDGSSYHGIIDLIVEYEDSIKIIDYKLKNIDDENYQRQLLVYKDYVSLKTNKKIDIYLFSILSGTLSVIS